MPHHDDASEGSRNCCNHLLDSLRVFIPDVVRAPSKETCALYVSGKNRFAHIYHRKEDESIRVYFRGDIGLSISDPTGAIKIQRRDKVEKGWDKEFPYFATLTAESNFPAFAKLVSAVAYPLSGKKKKLTTSGQVSVSSSGGVFLEGEKIQLTTVGYKRAVGARDACIAYYGSTCSICGFDFETAYGVIGRGYIHVHHLKAISAFEEEHEVDPIRDLRPVCPNCHAMLHHKSSPTLEELSNAISKRL
jgi:hypothetical protein